MASPSSSRRVFLGALGASAVAISCNRSDRPSTTGERASGVSTGETAGSPKGGAMQYRMLGKTGARVSILGVGGYHLGNTKSEAEAIDIVHAALDHGMNFLDNSWDYHDGESERRVGKALAAPGYRAKAFVMTKVDGRTKETARKQIDESLSRLGVDHLDLLQLHEVIRMEDPDRAFAPGGAIEALVEAQKAGKTRFLGFTGHKDPQIHLKMLKTAEAHGFRFDTVQMPLNVMDAHFRSFEQAVLPELVSRGIGVLGMKSMGAGKILKSDVVKAEECLRYALSLPTSVVITGCDSMPILEQALRIGSTFQPLKLGEREELLARTAEPAAAGKYEVFKTGDEHDSTSKHPEWLG